MSDKKPITSYYLKPITRQQLDELSKNYGECKSAVITRLVDRAHQELKKTPQ